jgi:hypothetical protein
MRIRIRNPGFTFTVYCSPPPPWSGPGRLTACRAPASSGARARRDCRRPAPRPAARPAGCPGPWTGRTGSPRRCTGWWPAGGSPATETNKIWIKGEGELMKTLKVPESGTTG